MERAGKRQLDLFERLTDLLSGFKELRLRARRSEDLYQDFGAGASALAADTLHTNILNQTSYVFANLNLFALLAATVFLLPHILPAYGTNLHNLVSAILFMFGAVGGMVSAIPQYRRANLAAEHIYALEQKLTRAAVPATQASQRRRSGLADFAAPCPGLCFPLSTLRLQPYGCTRMTRGRRGWLDLRRQTLSFFPPCRFIPALYSLAAPRRVIAQRR